MQRSKSMALTAQIFNKLSSKSFVSKTCSIHLAFLPIYICNGCFSQNEVTYCEECFKDHQCEKKMKGEVMTWVSQQQDRIVKCLNNLLRDFEFGKQSLISGKLKIGENEKYAIEINNEIVSRLTQSLSKKQKSIEQSCVKPAIESMSRSIMENYISKLRFELNNLTGKISDISQLANNCQINEKEAHLQLQNQCKKVMDDCSVFYREGVMTSILQVFTSVFGQKGKNQDVQTNLDEKLKHTLIENYEKDVNFQNQLIKDLQGKILSLQQQINIQKNIVSKLEDQKASFVTSFEQKLKLETQKRSELERKLQKYEKLISESSQKDVKIKKLENKCQIYETQLAEFARGEAGQYQRPQSRYNMEDLANKLTSLSHQYQTLVMECNQKDKKIAGLVVQINKMHIKKSQERVQGSSGKKTSQ